MRRSLVFFVLMAAVAAAPRAQSPKPAPAGPTYDVSFTLADGQIYSGTTTFTVDAKGVVDGKMVITSPTGVTSTLAGTLKDGVWTFKYGYTLAEQNCSGTVAGTAKVPADRKVITGSATIEGCSETPLSAVFTFSQQVKKD